MKVLVMVGVRRQARMSASVIAGRGWMALGAGEEFRAAREEQRVGEQTVRQAVRLAASGALAAQRRGRAERDRRLERLAVEVITAVGERDAAVRSTEGWARDALSRMVDIEGLSVAEAVEWCASKASLRDAARLRRQAGPAHEPSAAGTRAEPAGSGPNPLGEL